MARSLGGTLLVLATTAALIGCDGGATGAGGGGDGGSGGSGGAGGGSSASAFPFPQDRRFGPCVFPSNAGSADAKKAYEAWKSELVTADGAGGHLRVRRPDSPGAEVGSTVSEGIAYGMILSVMMDDQSLFDELWKYSQQWLDGNGLMHWYIDAAGEKPLGTGGATDSDEDIAWALVMADRQWGGQGSLDEPYIEAAKRQIQAIWSFEVDHDHGDLLRPGDQWGKVIFNPSYFAPSEYRVFGEVTGEVEAWGRVIDRGYEATLASLSEAAGNADNGLVPAWCDKNGAPAEPWDGGPTNYQYDSARTPFRIGLDYCMFAEPRALTYVEKTSAFFAGIGAGAITDGYDLDGTPHPDPDSDPDGPQSAVFVGSAAVGAMSKADHGPFVEDAYGRVATGELLARSRYYNLSWTALTLLAMSGNLVDYTHPDGPSSK